MKQRAEDDPVLHELLREQENAFREHRRALVNLRQLYLSSATPDLARAANLQQIAHDAEHRLADANQALTKYAWEIVPYSSNPEHLAKIQLLREEALKRTLAEKSVQQNGPVVIITRINGVKKRFID